MPVPNNSLSAPDPAGLKNENFVHCAYRLIGQLRQTSVVRFPKPRESADSLDWQAAEHEAHPIRSEGFFVGRKS